MKEFFRWLFKSKRELQDSSLSGKKEKQFLEMKAIWEESANIKMPETVDSEAEWFRLQRAMKIAENKQTGRFQNPLAAFLKSPRFAYGFSFAGVILIAFVWSYQWFGVTNYSTAYKENLSITLADGSVIQLHAGSELSVPKRFAKNARNLQLNGEAFFKVQKSTHPFRVQTENGNVTVLGTQFNVHSRERLMEVAVTEGRVQVTAQNDKSVFLTKGEMCYCEPGQNPTEPQVIEFAEYPGWLYEKLTVKETELLKVLKEIERRFDVEIQQDDLQLSQVKISGLFEASELDNLMQSICLLVQKDFRTEKNKIVIYSPKKGNM
jgi:transmembrane sensor